MSHITFTPLQPDHFSLLFKWLETPHVKQWWDKDIAWTLERVEEKYTPYTQGYKPLNGVSKPMHAFIIEADSKPIGYIQYYNRHDFLPEGYHKDVLPDSLAAIDIYIGEPDAIGKGLGSYIITHFLEAFIWHNFDYCCVDPDKANRAAIKAYTKAGFTIAADMPGLGLVLMMCAKDASLVS